MYLEQDDSIDISLSLSSRRQQNEVWRWCRSVLSRLIVDSRVLMWDEYPDRVDDTILYSSSMFFCSSSIVLLSREFTACCSESSRVADGGIKS